MRQIALDTETTGLSASKGHRIIEIGCVEIVNRRITNQRFHRYLQPNRQIDAGAMKVHGITNEFLQDKPSFADVVDEFMDFIKGAELIIHNAPFDVGFINHELNLLNKGLQQLANYCEILDTLELARARHPGQKNNLDALCKRYYVDNSNRQLHGALLDAEILADLYLTMTGGQVSLLSSEDNKASTQQQTFEPISSKRPALCIIAPTKQELQAHEQRLATIDNASGGRCLWRTIN
jgi:DNA polymerase-3 subunit epsilon